MYLAVEYECSLLVYERKKMNVVCSNSALHLTREIAICRVLMLCILNGIMDWYGVARYVDLYKF